MTKTLLFSLFLSLSFPIHATSVRAIALFSNKALLVIDGNRHMVSVGKAPIKGVRLVMSDSKKAIVDINGVRRTLLVGQFADGGIAERRKTVTITRNNQGQFIVEGLINQKPVDMLVDTGANVMAMNALEARRAGIDYQNGRIVQVGTASEHVNAYLVELPSVVLGDIEVKNVEATVHEGTHPEIVLLGMSFLEHVKMNEENGVMTLEAKE